ncbi:hypothetical protein [Actinoplanes sp. GCM10030250]|uniref:hypothetical protein n=1 Tax=Actinoplanes sp. GCM10030250 TaxID=3273376 RepID=UPI00361E9096
MAFRSWVKLLATTALAAAVVGAGQLGIAYGLGMVRLDLNLDVTLRDQWTAQLAWVAWITMTAAAIGTIVGTGIRPRWRPQPVGIGGALAMGIAASFGALAVLPLTMQPARAAQIDGVRPVFVIGVCAGLAAAVGVFAAWAVAAKAVARWNLATLTILIWVVGLVSVAPSLLPGRTPTAPRLGVLEGSLIPDAIAERTPFVTMPVLALLAGLVLGWVARGRRKSTIAVALTGLTGPAVLTVAYLIAGPGGGATGFTLSPYWAAMIASGAGVLGSVLAAIGRGAPATTPAEASDQPGGTPSSTSPEPAADHPPLPQRNAPNQSAIAVAAATAAQRPEAQLRPSDTGVLTADRPHPLADLANNTPANAATSPSFSGTAKPAPHVSRAPAPHVPGTPEPRFSGQQAPQPNPAPSARRGWRTRRPANDNPPAHTPSFNGFTTAQPTQPAQRAPLVPDSISPPPPGVKESEYVNWVNGLGSA